MTRREIVRFLVWAFVPAAILEALAGRYHFTGPGRGLLLATMWVPALAALVSSRASRRMAFAALRRLGWRSLLPALLLGWSFLAVQQLLLLATGTGRWNANVFPLAPGGHGVAGIHHVATVLGGGAQGWPHFALNLVLSITLGSALTAMIGGVGEELGWRAVLQPALQARHGRLRGTLMVGGIWAAWHLPVNLVGYNDAEHPLAGSLVFFPLFVVALSFVLAWLVERSGSVWPAALAHGANNVLGAGLLLTATGWWADQLTMLASAVLVGGAVAWVFVRQGAPRPPETREVPAEILRDAQA